MKEKYATTDMRKHQNRMAFGVQEEETMEGRGLDILHSLFGLFSPLLPSFVPPIVSSRHLRHSTVIYSSISFSFLPFFFLFLPFSSALSPPLSPPLSPIQNRIFILLSKQGALIQRMYAHVRKRQGAHVGAGEGPAEEAKATGEAATAATEIRRGCGLCHIRIQHLSLIYPHPGLGAC
jgi:hypothetical protein